MCSEDEESWHSTLEPTTVKDILKTSILEYIPTIGISLSTELRRRSWELVDCIKIPVGKVKDNYILDNPFCLIKKVNKLVIGTLNMERVKESLTLLQSYSSKSIDIYGDISEITVETSRLRYKEDSESESCLENFIFTFLDHLKKTDSGVRVSYIRKLALKNVSISAFDFLQLLSNEPEFSKLSELSMTDCQVRSEASGLEPPTNCTIKVIEAIRTRPLISKYCLELQKIVFEPPIHFPAECDSELMYDFFPDDCYDGQTVQSEGSKKSVLKSVELVIPNNMRDNHFINTCFIDRFPHIESLRELKIVGNRDRSTKYQVASSIQSRETRQWKRSNSGYNISSFKLTNMYLSLETLEHLLRSFNLENEYENAISGDFDFDEEAPARFRNQNVIVDFNVEFEDSHRHDKYSIKRYNNLTIEEESNFFLNSDMKEYGFGGISDNNRSEHGGNAYEYNRGFGAGRMYTGIFGFGRRNADSNKNDVTTATVSHSRYNHHLSGCKFGSTENSTNEYRGISNSEPLGHRHQHSGCENEIFVKPYINIRKWSILANERYNRHMSELDRQRKEMNRDKFGVVILDDQTDSILQKKEGMSRILCNLISKTLVCNVVDHLRTKLVVSPNVVALSIGYDNLIYSGYLLNVIHYYQQSIQELSVMTCLIPMDRNCFVNLRLSNIRVLRVTLFKNKDLKPEDLIGLCTWLNKYGKRLEQVHIRITGVTSDWIPTETEMRKLESTWKKISPIAGGRDKVKFECCFTDHIFSRINRNEDLCSSESSD